MIPSNLLYVNSLHLSFLQQSSFRLLSSFLQEEIGPNVICDTSNAKIHVVLPFGVFDPSPVF